MSLLEYIYTFFKNVVVFDFEYSQTPGNNPKPVCCTFKELKTGKQITQWYLSGSHEWPFKDEDTIYICHNAVAEVSCMLDFGLKVPLHIWDTMIQDKKLCNGKIKGFSLLKCCNRYGIETITESQKTVFRDIIINNFPMYTAQERDSIIKYNVTDVVENAALFKAQCAEFQKRDSDYKRTISQAIFHGRAMGVCAAIERNGIPINNKLFNDLEKYYPEIKAQEIKELQSAMDIYDGEKFNNKKFEKFLIKAGIINNWPKTDSGQCKTDDKTLYRYATKYPAIQQLRESKFIIEAKNLKGYQVGKDGKSRTSLNMFGQITGRTNCSTATNPFGAPRRMRNVIGTDEDHYILYADWKSQEVVIQAALSNDSALMEAVETGDPYIDIAVKAKAVPKGSTKASHPVERELYKQTLLATAYGQTAFGLKTKLDITEAQAIFLLEKLHFIFPTYFKWIRELVSRASAVGYFETVFGWKYFLPNLEPVNPRRLMNWPLQSHGSEILRRAIIDLYDSGYEIVMPVHDAVLIHMKREPWRVMRKKINKLKNIMSEAAKEVIGTEIKVDVDFIRNQFFQGKVHQDRWDKLYEKLQNAKMEVHE